jgi:hypothetical protein
MKAGLLLCGLLLSFINFAQLNQKLYDQYDTFRESAINSRRFKHENVMQILNRLGNDFSVSAAGASVEGRAIKHVTYGTGPTRVLLWSQMHGDEPTATQALFDMFNWLSAEGDGFDALRGKIKTSVTLHIIPMLNPDGAARFTRRNFHDIDINRDALRLQTPEGRILKRVRDSLQADWGFNLHDQGRGTSVNDKPASVSLLAPAFNPERHVNETRGDAMKLVRLMFNQLQPFIPGQVGIYPDDFEPRAFGDNIQKWGTRTILIESGGYRDDYERQEIRKLNFVMLITALESIATASYKKIAIKDYHQIPKNSPRRLHELLVLNINIEGLVRDAAFDRREIDNNDYRQYYARSYVSDLGDLHTANAYVVFDANGYTVEWGKFYDRIFKTVEELRAVDLKALLQQGFTDFVVHEKVNPFVPAPLTLPVNLHNTLTPAVTALRLGANPSLVFRKNGVVEMAVVNGRLISLAE